MAKEIHLSSRVKLVSYAIRDIVQKANEVKARGVKLHSFNIGDPNRFDFYPPEHITEAIHAALDNPRYSGYAPSEGDPELRDAVAKFEGVSPQDVFITAGLSEGINFLFQAMVDPGDNFLLPLPSYPLYNSISRVLGAEENNYKADSNWMPDVDDVRKKITPRTRALLIINPNNPTGAVYPSKLLKQLADVAGEHNLPIISDEIYNKLTFEEPAVPLCKIAKDVPVIAGNGLSKNFVYTGARVGYVALHGGEEFATLRASLQKLCNARLSINWEMQRGAIAAFTRPLGHVPGLMARLKPRRDLIHKRLNEIPGISATLPGAAFYIFPKIESPLWQNDKDFAYDVLDNTGIVGVPGSGFSSSLPGKFFRLVYLAKEAEISEAMDKLEAFMRKRGA